MKNWITEGVASDAKDKSKKTLHTVILQSWISKNFAFQAWNPNWKDFLKYFESYLGRSQFSTLTELNPGFALKNCQNGTFEPMHEIQKIFCCIIWWWHLANILLTYPRVRKIFSKRFQTFFSITKTKSKVPFLFKIAKKKQCVFLTTTYFRGSFIRLS